MPGQLPLAIALLRHHSGIVRLVGKNKDGPRDLTECGYHHRAILVRMLHEQPQRDLIVCKARLGMKNAADSASPDFDAITASDRRIVVVLQEKQMC